eukprot:gene8740-6146_t
MVVPAPDGQSNKVVFNNNFFLFYFFFSFSSSHFISLTVLVGVSHFQKKRGPLRRHSSEGEAARMTLRHRCRRVVTSPTPTRASCAALVGATAEPRRHFVQNRDQLLAEHGAGFTRHQSIADKNLPTKIAGFHTPIRAAPAADLFRTPLHQGLGTSEKDPYTRTLPNMESVPPASTVLSSTSAEAPSREEEEHIRAKWYTLQKWFTDTYPRMPLFLDQCKVPDALPVSATAEALLQELTNSVLPSLAENAEELNKLQQWWTEAQTAYRTCSSQHVLDREKFIEGVQDIHLKALRSIENSSSKDKFAMALEVLHRKTVLAHNATVEAYYGAVAKLSPTTEQHHPTVMWQQFLTSVQEHKRELFIQSKDATLGYAWNALTAEEGLRPPSMTAPVALFFALTTRLLQQKAMDASNASVTLQQKGPSSAYERYKELVPVTSRRRFVMQEVAKILTDSDLTKQLARLLNDAGFYELRRDVLMCEAMQNDGQLLRLEAESVAAPFDSVPEVKSLFSSIHQSDAVEAKHHLCTVLSLPFGGRQGNWDAILDRLDWRNTWKKLAVDLMANKAFTTSALHFIKNAIGAKGVHRRLFHPNYADTLNSVVQARVSREATRRRRVEELSVHLASYEMREAAAAADAIASGPKTPAPEVSMEALQATLRSIRVRHPSWVKAGVIPASSTDSSTELKEPIDALRLMVRMFIRLAYVPQAGAAMIAQHTRRRIGPVGLEPHQFNVPTEFGKVEQYDNLLYKRYDWQGWYQRMVDIHNRNVSIRCCIDDLKRLDAYGNPFVDLQTERRLRVVSGNRVGVGVLKLDSDKYEDQSDNITFGTTKLSELLAEARKAQLGPEYWPTVEVKVRRPSGQSQAYYSIIDNDRIEERSKELYDKYKEAKKRSLFVTPMDLWLEVKGAQTSMKTEVPDEDGYATATLQASLDETDDQRERARRKRIIMCTNPDRPEEDHEVDYVSIDALRPHYQIYLITMVHYFAALVSPLSLPSVRTISPQFRRSLHIYIKRFI